MSMTCSIFRVFTPFANLTVIPIADSLSYSVRGCVSPRRAHRLAIGSAKEMTAFGKFSPTVGTWLTMEVDRDSFSYYQLNKSLLS